MRRPAHPVRRRLLAVILATAVLATACRAIGDRPASGYVVEAVFPEAVALYEQSRVKVMGFDVGRVEAIDVQPDHVVVRMRIDEDVPLPAEVNAAIVAFTVIGERNVLLHPAWKPGMARADDGTRIPPSRTRVPVEVDESLDTFVTLAETVDADTLERLLSSSADAVAGRGDAYGQALDEVADLVGTIDALDERALALSEDVSALAATLTDREEQVVELVEAVGGAADVLSAHRDDAEALLGSLRSLDEEGGALLAAIRDDLPRDLARLARLGLVLRANTTSVQELAAALLVVADTVLSAFDEDVDAIILRTSIPNIVDSLVRGRFGLEELP